MWRFDDDAGSEAKDTSANCLHGTIKGEGYSVSAFRGDEPMETEDKWGKAVKDLGYLETNGQCAIEIDGGWSKEALTGFCFEAWMWLGDSQAVFLYSQAKLEFLYDGSVFRLVVEQREVASTRPTKLKLHQWHHIAVSISEEENSVDILLNGETVFNNSEMASSLEDFCNHPVQFFPNFNGRFTEVRLWSKARELSEIRDNMTTPLSIAVEEEPLIIFNIKKPGEKRDSVAAQADDFGFDFGDINPVADDQAEVRWDFDADTTPTDKKDEKEPAEVINQKTDHKAVDEKNGMNDVRKEGNLTKTENVVKETEESKPLQVIAEPIKVNTAFFEERSAFVEEKPQTNVKEDTQVQDDTPRVNLVSLFKHHKFVPALSASDNVESLVAALFQVNADVSAFLAGLSSILLKAVKRCRACYLNDDFEGANLIVALVFRQFHEVVRVDLEP